jgi:hypothetical protein
MHPRQLRVSRVVIGAAFAAVPWLAAQALGLVHGVLRAPGVPLRPGSTTTNAATRSAHADALGTAAAGAAAAPAALPCPVLRGLAPLAGRSASVGLRRRY